MEATLELPDTQEPEPMESTPLISDIVEPEVHEIPDMELVVEHFLGQNAVTEIEPEFQNLDDHSELDIDKAEAIMRTIHRINLVSLDPVDLMIISVSVDDPSNSHETLVDSGAEVNLISSEIVRDLGLESKPTSIILNGLGQSCHATVGEISLSLNIHGRKFPFSTFHVIPPGVITEPIVIGYDFLKANGISVDCARNCLVMAGPAEGSFWEYYVADKDEKCHQVCYGFNVTAAESVSLNYPEPSYIPVNIDFPQGFNLNFTCPDCDLENVPEYFYDGQIVTPGLADKASGIPGIIQLDSSPSVLVASFDSEKALVKKGDIVGKIYTILILDPPLSCFNVQKGELTSTNETLSVISKIPLAEDVDLEQQLSFQQMLKNHLPVISTSDEDVGACASIPIRIKLYDETPIYQRARRFSPPVNDAIEEQCKELHNLDIIEPSISPWSSPVVPVIKPDKSLRLCVDYRKLNKVTVPDRFPMPNLTDSVFSLQGIKYFTSLDLVRGYYQLPLAEESKEYTAFSTAQGHWQFKRLSFGLKNAPAVFQREMQRILREFPKSLVIIYIDDILILGRTFEEHLKLVNRVLAILQKHGLKIKLSKCSWFQTEVQFLGHLVGRTGMQKLPEYVKKVEEFPKPTTVREMRGFLGLVNFQRKFIPRCSTICKPLFAVTGGRKRQGNKKVLWTPEMDLAFERLKDLIKEQIQLSFPDYSPDAKPLELFVDASGEGAGACLCQEQGGTRVVIAYNSMTFLDAETRYSAIERELSALRWGVKSFRSFLYGRFFIVYSDHRPLIYLDSMKMIDARLARTLEDLNGFDYIVKYYPGKLNTVADWLSRLPGVSAENVENDDCHKLPVGLHVYNEVSGGPNSMLESLVICLKHLYEESGKDSNRVPTINKLRSQVVEQFLKDAERLGFSLTKLSRKHIKAMRYPGSVPALELLLAISSLFSVEVWVHFGPSNPVVFHDPAVLNPFRIHLQCLAGVHFNPLIELKSYLVPDNFALANRNLKKTDKEEAPILEDSDDTPDVPAVLYSSEMISLTLDCQHNSGHPVQCVVYVKGTPCCALLDTGAQVSLVNASTVERLGLSRDLGCEDQVLKGLVSENSIVLGVATISVTCNIEAPFPEFPFAIVAPKTMNFCFILGRNFMKRVQWCLNFSRNLVLCDTRVLTTIGIQNVADSSNRKSIMTVFEGVELNETDLPVICSLFSFEQLKGVQEKDRVIHTVVKFVKAGQSKFNLPRSCRIYRKVWSNLEVKYDLLWTKNLDGKLVFVSSFSFLIDLSADSHLNHAHIGIFKLTYMLRKLVWHPSLVNVVRDLCRTCSVCQKCKVSSIVSIPPTLRIHTTSPFELLALDLVNLPTTTSGFVGCLMVVDHFSKWVSAVPIRNKQSHTVCKALEGNILPMLQRIPVRILTDNGPEFVSQEFNNLLDRYNIVHVYSTPYKPSSNGAIERVNRTIGELLRILTQESRKWDLHLPRAVLTYNHTVHSEIGCTPAEKILKISYDIDSQPLLSAEIRHPWANGSPRYRPFHVGSFVLKKTVLVGNLTTNKLLPRFDGPYQVIKVFSNNVTYQLIDVETGKTVKAHHIQLKLRREPPGYLKGHFRRGGDDVSERSPNPNAPVALIDPTVSDSDESDLSDFPDMKSSKLLTTLLENTVPENRPKHSKIRGLVSILKPSYTYERKQALRIWEDSNSDPTPVLVFQDHFGDGLSATDVSSLTVSTLMSSSGSFENLADVLDWDVSPIGSVPSSSLDRSHINKYATNPFRNIDGSFKTREQLLDEVSQDEQDHDINLFNLCTCVGQDIDSSFVVTIEQDVIHTSLGTNPSSVSFPGFSTTSNVSIVTSPNSLDFSGFSLSDVPVSSSEVTQPCCRLRKTTTIPSSTSLSVMPGRVSLSPVLQDIQEARQLIENHRRASRARLINQNRRFSYPRGTAVSPPFTRSRGNVVPLPHVQVKTLERELTKRKEN